MLGRVDTVPTWVLGLVVALLAWAPGFSGPAAGLDVSWWSGLYMAAHDQMQFGQQIVFTYGPLGFLKLPWLFYSDLAALAYVYTSGVFVAFAISLVWALRRAAGTIPAFLGSFLVLALVPGIELALAVAVFAAFRVMSERPGDRVLFAYAGAGGAFAAAEVLMKLSVGPQILLVLLIGLVCCRPRRGHLLLFAGTFSAGFLIFWWATGQALSGLPDFALNSVRITAGYNEAMAVGVAQWWKPLVILAAVAATVAWVWRGRYPDRRARVGALIIALSVGFASYKQGIVRADEAHVAIFLTTMAVLWLAVPSPSTLRPLQLVAGAALFAVAVGVVGTAARPGLDVVSHVDRFVDGGRLLVDSGRRDRLVEDTQTRVAYEYEIKPRVAFGLVGQRLTVEPWETMVAWAYGLEWDPVPVFQNYSAYTRSLDEMNAEAISDPEGATALLREAAPRGFRGESIDDRLQVWDPPAQAVASLCHFKPAVTAGRWQLSTRVPDRCSGPIPIGTVEAGEGEAVPVPEPAANEVILVDVAGAELTPLQKLISLAYRPPLFHVVPDDGSKYRLVPATSGDGLMLRSGRRVREDRGRFSPIPQTRTIAVEGAGDDLEFEFFRMKVR